ncbi:hypothetical protein [Streptacidiphilus sp. PAMC 29251]
MSDGSAEEEYRISARAHWEQAMEAAAEARKLLTPPAGGSVSEERRAEAESLMRMAESYTRLTELALRLGGAELEG